jgi:hypothetical protein
MIVLLLIEMTVIYRYYSYINGPGHSGVAKGLLLMVAVLNSARNSLSFFMLLITSMGYGVVRPSLGPIMMKVRFGPSACFALYSLSVSQARSLGAIHFIFGVL